MQKKKIAIFTGYFLPHLGGVERYVDKISAALSKLGYEIVIVTSNHDDLESYENSDTYSIYRLPILSIAKERYPIPRFNQEYKQLIKRVEQEKADFFIVNTRFHLTSLVGAKMAKRLNKPALLIEHGTDHFSVNNKILDFFGAIYEHILTRIIKKYVDGFYGVSNNCNIWLKHFSIKAKGVFYNAINVDDRKKTADYYKKQYLKNEIVITYAGRLIKEKGILNLVEAFERLDPKKSVRLVVAGDGELMQVLKNSNNRQIDILGKLDFNHVMALYKRTDIFVYPSLYPEGLPTSILEAGLMDCAIVATPRGGTEEVVVDDQHGIIVDGSVDSLHQAISKLIADSSLRKLQAKKVRARIERKFNWDAVAKDVDRAIKEFDK